MGVDTRKPPLPAPTESSTLQTSGGSIIGTDLATDISRRTDRTSFSIPEDGSPVTISTRRKRDHRDKERGGTLTKASHHSQTSLLIEYFEGGKGPKVSSRPSVRVKVTPSAARKIKDSSDHIQITEPASNRKPSYTKRISLGTNSATAEVTDDRSTDSYTSAAEESSVAERRPPIEIEVMHKDQGSDLSGTSMPVEDRHYHVNPSEISSMPPDSMIEGGAEHIAPHRTRSRSISRDAVVTTKDMLKAPSRRRSRSLSKERIAQKVAEKLGNRPRQVSSSKHKHDHKISSRSASTEHILEDSKTPKRRSSRQHAEEALTSGAESSVLTNSQLSSRRRSGDQFSVRSGNSKSSINNPKLLETVEDAIRRLIMPELAALKHQQNRSNFDRGAGDSTTSGSAASRGDLTRRISKHASAPDVAGKPKVVLNRDENDPGIVLSGNSIKSRKEMRRRGDYEGESEHRSERDISEETVVQDYEDSPRRHHRDSHRLKDAAAGGITGAILTHAALKHHDSKSSIDRRERRRRKSSRSHSRSTSVAESPDEIFHKHDIPPMPMRSDINGSELTRESILSEKTEEPSTPTSERRVTEIRNVSRGSPREVLSPASRTPTRTPLSLHKGLGTHHSNVSNGDLSVHNARSDHNLLQEAWSSKSGLAALGVGAGTLTAGHVLDNRNEYLGNSYNHHANNRGLSPIQSVASYKEETEPPPRDTFLKTQSSAGSLSSVSHYHRKHSGLSINSLSSAASTNVARSQRPHGIHLEKVEDVLGQHDLRKSGIDYRESSQQDPAIEAWYDQQHEENDRYRDSFAEEGSKDPTVDIRHPTNYTEDSMDAPYLDKVTAAQHMRGVGANAEYIHTPVAVESAVASLLDPSVVSLQPTHSNLSHPNDRYTNSADVGHNEYSQYYEGSERGIHSSHHEVEFETAHAPNADVRSMSGKSYNQRSAADSARQSYSQSLEDKNDQAKMTASGLPVADDPIPEIGHGIESDSDLNTNPSIIQGPIGGPHRENLDHWPYEPTPPQSKGDFLRSNEHSAHDSLKAAAANMMNVAADAKATATQNQQQHIKSTRSPSLASRSRDGHVPAGYTREQGTNHDFGRMPETYFHDQSIPTPPMAKDEGYISAAPGAMTPDINIKGPGPYEDDEVDEYMPGEDPFVATSHARHLSGNSHGMPSPLYDSSTGRGIDRIQSKDIVALMDHLTVRDAQRNARDTEILVTLVRSAAEMRNSFEDMKKFIVEQDDMLMDTSKKQHDRTQKIIGGPRPQPLGTARAPRGASEEDAYLEEAQAKRRNVFKRAIKGLGMRSNNDFSKIEGMLVQLLGEVEGLKAAQDFRPSIGDTRPESQGSYGNDRMAESEGYEPEGQAGTGSSGNQSGYFSNPATRSGSGLRGYEVRRGSQNRVSTVLEGDEDLEAHEQIVLANQFEKNEHLLTPTQEHPRAGSVPLDTPPQIHVPTGTLSNENTPRTITDKSRKHKSSSSSFFPKISRWSKTTASSVGDNFKNNSRREQPFSEASRSGSDVPYDTTEHYDPQGDDRLRSAASVEDHIGQENRPPSPLIPSQVSEGPKYQAHRNSLNLQHPQPRQGPTPRYQTHLESQAQNFGSPISPTSDTFGSNPSLARFAPVGPGNRASGGPRGLSPISDTGYSEDSVVGASNAPTRPPKVRDDGPLIPSRPPKIASKDNKPTFASPLGNVNEESRYSNGSSGYEAANGSPRSASGQAVPQRKPTGPRPNTSGSYSPGKPGGVKRNRYRGSPNHIDSSTEDVTF